MTLLMAEQSRPNIGQIVQEYGKRLFRFIRRRVRKDADAEDILQDVWYQFSNVVNVEPIEQLGAWLFTAARNRVTDSYRKRRPYSLEDFLYEDEEGDYHIKDILLGEEASPEMHYLRQVFWDQLMDALDELPEAQRDVFVWNELEDETFQSIADRTGENIKTLISRKRYAVQHLRKRLDILHRELLYPSVERF